MEQRPQPLDRKRWIGAFISIGILSRISRTVADESGLSSTASFSILGSLLVLVVVIGLYGVVRSRT